MIRVCACLAGGAAAGVALFGVVAYVVLMYGPDTNISF